MKRRIEMPEYKKDAFTCPSCSVFSKHDWTIQYVNESTGTFSSYGSANDIINKLLMCKCQNCGYISFWYKGKLAWPLNVNVESPIEEMPDDIKELYNEARSIVYLSPKGSCAILRLALQKLCNRLAKQPETKKIDGAIKILVENGLPITIQQAMDTVRILGDEAVHPGEINIDDNKEYAVALFRLINIIVEKMIVEPREIEEFYNMMPDNKLEGIKNRDKKKE